MTLIEIACAKILQRVEERMISIRGAIEDYIRIDPSVRNVRDVILALCLGTVRNYILLDRLLNYVGISIEKLDNFRKYLLRVLAYEIKFRNIQPDRVARVLKSSKIANVRPEDILKIKEITVEEVVKDLNNVEKLSVIYSIPRWLVEYLLKYFPENEVEKMLKAFNEKAVMYIRVNITRISRDELVRRLRDRGADVIEDEDLPDIVKVRSLNISLEKIPEYREGLFYIQDKASALVSHVAVTYVSDARNVLDVCSAPGGKAMHLSELKNRKIHITALDVSYKRIETENNLLKKYSYYNVDVICTNALKPCVRSRGFDLVLVDPDCTSLGKLAHSPEVRLWIRKHHINEYARHQYKILRAVISNVCTRSTYILYSTCTITFEENEHNIKKLIDEQGLELVELSSFSKFQNPFLKGTLRLFPHVHETNGYFIALLKL